MVNGNQGSANKNTMRQYYTHSRIAKIFKKDNMKCGPIHGAVGNSMFTHLYHGPIFKSWTYTYYDPVSPLPEVESSIEMNFKKTHTRKKCP